MNRKKRDCWQIALNSKIANTGYLGFQLGPRINASSRMTGQADTAINFFLEQNISQASSIYEELDRLNNKRQQIQTKMFNDASDAFSKDEPAFVYYDKNNFAGIQGVVASKISEKFGIPTIMLADIGNSLVSGSGRAGQFLHLQDALQTFDEIYPDILISYGGHKAAAGIKLHKNNIKTFQNGFYNIVKEQLQGQDITPYIKTDGSLNGQINFGTYNQIEQLSPFGIGFPTPVFFDKMVVTNLRVMGNIPVHLSMMLDGNKAVLFNALNNPGEPVPLYEGERIAVTYTLNSNVWHGKKNLQLIIKSIVKSDEHE